MIYLELPDLVYVAERAIGAKPQIRDAGLLEAAVARPRASAFGVAVYDTLPGKAAAMVHSLARNHALVDGNKRLTLGALIAFLGMNGLELTMSNDGAYDFIVAVASGELNDVDPIAQVLIGATVPRS